MQYLQLTLDKPVENLALDEALLDAAEADEIEGDLLRLWELPDYCVVLGRSSQVEIEVDLAACRSAQVPVLRRASGGGTILAGPGCLMYTLVLGFTDWPQLPPIDQAHRWVLNKLSTMLEVESNSIQPAGTSDLVLSAATGDQRKKFSGNAMRRKRRHLLYHGTLLYDFDLSRISQFLARATRTPNYRNDRSHDEFVTNLPVDRETLISKLIQGWQADVSLKNWPLNRTNEIVAAKYNQDPNWTVFSDSQ